MSKYNERVTARAQEFAMELMERSFEIIKLMENEPLAVFNESDFKDEVEKGMKEFMGAARLSVAREAEAFKGGYNKAWSDANNEYHQPISDILIDHGLIPPPNETT